MEYLAFVLLAFLGDIADCQLFGQAPQPQFFQPAPFVAPNAATPHPTTKPPFLDPNCCIINPQFQRDCGIVGVITQNSCYARGCCYSNDRRNKYTCYAPLDPPCQAQQPPPQPVATTAPPGYQPPRPGVTTPPSGFLPPVTDSAGPGGTASPPGTNPPRRPTGKCDIERHQRAECSIVGTTRASCLQSGCCFDDKVSGNTPHCYFSHENAPQPSKWSDWSKCPPAPACYTGTRSRSRICLYRDGKRAPNGLCKSKFKQTENCTCVSAPLPAVGPQTGDGVCKDQASTCDGFQTLCDSSESFKKTLCRATCGQCAPGSAQIQKKPALTPGACKDKFLSCDQIKQHCADPYYLDDLINYCPVTCNLCDIALKGLTTKPATTTTKATAPTTPPPTITSATTSPAVGASGCRDKRENCQANRVYCNSGSPEDIAFMNEFCPATCGTCPPAGTSSVVTECKDQYQSCKKNKKLCTEGTFETRLVMLETCQLTCGSCDAKSGQSISQTKSEPNPPAVTSGSVNTPATPNPFDIQYTLPPTQTPYAAACVNTLEICDEYESLCFVPDSEWTINCPETCNVQNCANTPRQPFFTLLATESTPHVNVFATLATTASAIVPKIVDQTDPPPYDRFEGNRGPSTAACRDIYDDCHELVPFCAYPEEHGQVVRENCLSTCGLCDEQIFIQAPNPQVVAAPTAQFSWTQWSLCTVTCGGGTKSRMKICSQGAQNCSPDLVRQQCALRPCRDNLINRAKCEDRDGEWCKKMVKIVTSACDNDSLASNCQRTCRKC